MTGDLVPGVVSTNHIVDPVTVLALTAAATAGLATVRWLRPGVRRPSPSVTAPRLAPAWRGRRHDVARSTSDRTTRRHATVATPPVVIITAAACLVVFGPAAAAVVGTAAVTAGPFRRRQRARRHGRQVDAALPDAVEMLVLVIQAGLTPSQALTVASELVPAPLRPAFAAIDHRLQRGQRLADALGALPDHLGPAAAPLADAIAAADRYGLPLAPMLDRLADDARASRRRLSDTYARTLSVRLSFPLVVCTLPAFVLLAIVPALLGALSSLRQPGP
jgi:tight adherence protein C